MCYISGIPGSWCFCRLNHGCSITAFCYEEFIGIINCSNYTALRYRDLKKHFLLLVVQKLIIQHDRISYIQVLYIQLLLSSVKWK